jgi:beta-glucanase (GH16 family)
MAILGGDDHNGTAKMKEKQVRLLNDELILTADLLGQKEGKSSKDPHLPITYHSGAVYSKELVCVDDQYTEWILQGDFKAPVDSGTWPAFWITGSETWPPESDILEFKGNNVNWQNTVDGADWQHTDWQTKKTTVNTAADEWHHYKLRMKKLENNLVGLEYYIDGKLIAAHQANFFTKPFRVVINLQMEQASGKTGVGPKQAIFRGEKSACHGI